MSIIKLKDYAGDLARIAKHGLPKGVSPGWKSLSELYRVQRGMMTTITGIPGHGKSEFLDAMLVNLARLHNWSFCLYSPENYPIALHAIKLIEKVCGTKYCDLTESRRDGAHKWVDDHFTFLYPPDNKCTLVDILDLVKQVRCSGFVLDPWNEVDHSVGSSQTSETDYISKSLTKIRRFSRENDIHTWIVAHPQKLRKNDKGAYDPPDPYSISGSAHWRNKSDFCITAHRYDMMQHVMTIIIQKVKFKNFGKLGSVEFDYNYETGLLSER